MKPAPFRIAPAVLLLGLTASAATRALPPPNDDWSARIEIPPASLAGGFGNSQPEIAEATTSTDDPLLVCKNGDPQQRGNTVWYRLDLRGQPAPVYLNVEALGYDAVVAVFTGVPGSFRPVTGACNDDGASGFAARLNGLRLAAGEDYSIVVARPAQSPNVATLAFAAAAAPQYLVSKTEDTRDGSCNADCSLREALVASNLQPGAVLLPAGTFPITLAGSDNGNASGDFDLGTGMGIYGAGAAATRIVGLAGERVFDLEPANPANVGSTFLLADLAVANGGGIGPGAGINVANGNDHLALQRVLLENNVSTLLPGGAVSSNGPTVVDGSHIRNNTSAGNGGGLALGSGSVLTRIDVFGSTLSGNSSLSASSGGGGAIYAQSSLFLYNSTVAGNSARFSGGGILSTTFNGRVLLLNATLAENRADSDGNGSGSGGGLRVEGSAASSFNTVYADNLTNTTADECSRTPALIFNAAIGNHLAGISPPATDCGFGAGNVIGMPARLGPLADNGGLTPTRRPLGGSPLVDSGSAADCLGVDQRGQPRPADGDANGTALCDKGAVELTSVEGDALFRDGYE